MTDKEMAEKKSEYFERFDHEPINIEYIWDWIEELIEEVEGKGILIGEPFRETKTTN